MLIWIVQYRTKVDEHDSLSVYTDEVEAQKRFIELKNNNVWDYVTIKTCIIKRKHKLLNRLKNSKTSQKMQSEWSFPVTGTYNG